MQETDLFTKFTEKLSTARLSYMVTGSVACIIYGEPRLTYDLDIILDLPANSIKSFLKQFPEKDFYVPPHEVIMVEINRAQRGHINVIDFSSGFKLDVYFPGEDLLIHWGLSKSREISYKNSSLKIAPPEYVVLQKLRFYKEGKSEKHIRDIKSMLSVSKEDISFTDIENWAQELGLIDVWKNLNL